MLKKAVIFTVLLCFCIGNLCFADSSRMLDKNTELHPQGWSVGETIKFKKKTAVRLNDIGEVISGTLADDTYLRPQGWQRIINDNYFVSAYTGGAWFPRHHRYWPGLHAHQRYRSCRWRLPYHRPDSYHALLHCSGHGRSHHCELLHHGCHLRSDPDSVGCAAGMRSLLCVLLRHPGRYHAPCCPGGLRRQCYRKV